MASLFSHAPFVDFGPTSLDPLAQIPAVFRVQAGRPSALRLRVRQESSRQPGVYGMVDAHGELIYVGKAKSLRARLLSYFRGRSRDPKAGRILQRTATVVWECWPSELAALHRELELIRRWRPRYNVQGQLPGRLRTYLCLGRQPAPYAFLTRRLPRGVLAAFGPVPAGARAREAVRRLNDWFRLRDCPKPQEMVFAEQVELFPIARSAGCLRLEIGTCLGPCAGTCSRQDYNKQVKAALSFLTGADNVLLDRLEKEMAEASAALAFERAAEARDRREALRWLRDRLDRLQKSRERDSFVYPVKGADGKEQWYAIHGGRTVAVILPPTDAASARAAERTINALFRNKAALKGILPPDHVDGFMLIASWFRRHPKERRRVLEPAEALALCRDRALAR
jgi:excinuclease ABC subunit C